MIRVMQEQDLPAVLDIYNDAILHTTVVYTYEPWTLEQMKAWYQRKKQAGNALLVFEQGEQVAGYADYGSFRDWTAYKYTIEHSIYVHPAYRRQGIATALMQALIAQAEAAGYKTMIAGIDAENDASILLHQRLGFTSAGILKKVGYKFNRWLDLAFYQRELKGPEHPLEK